MAIDLDPGTLLNSSFVEPGRVDWEGKGIHKFEQLTLLAVLSQYQESGTLAVVGPVLQTMVAAAVSVALFDFVSAGIRRVDPTRRVTVALIGRLPALRSQFRGIRINPSWVADLSNRRAEALRNAEPGLFMDMNDRYFGHVYWSHFIRRREQKVKLEPYLPLHDFFPVGTVLKGGRIIPLGPRDWFGKHDSQNPVFLLARDPSSIGESEQPVDLVLVDLTSTGGELPRFQQPAVYFTDNPADPRIRKLAMVADNAVVWTSALMREIESECPVCSGHVGPSPVHWVTVPVNDEFDQLLSDTRRSVARLRSLPGARTLSAKVSLLTAVLLGLPVAPREYDWAAIPLGRPSTEDLLEELYERIKEVSASDPEVTGIAYDVYHNLRSILRELEHGNPKQALLADTFASLADRAACIVAESVPVGFSLRSALGNGGTPCIETIKNLPDSNEPVIMTGCLTGSALKFLAYDNQREVWIIAYPDELRAFVKKAGDATEALRMLATKKRRRWLATVCRDPRMELTDPSLSSLWVSALYAGRKHPGLGGGKGEDPRIEELPDPEDRQWWHGPHPERREGLSGKDEVPSRLLVFDDGRSLYLPSHRRLDVVNPQGEQIERIPVSDLRSGANILAINGELRQSLLEVVLQEAEELPGFSDDALMVRFWQDSIAFGFHKLDVTYVEVLARLQGLGSRRESSAAVRGWVTGDAMGPRDDRDIERAGVVLNLPQVSERWLEIAGALSSIRRLHKAAARDLNTAILSAIRGEGFGLRNGELFKWGLDATDFAEAISLMRLRSVSEEDVSVAVSELGRPLDVAGRKLL